MTSFCNQTSLRHSGVLRVVWGCRPHQVANKRKLKKSWHKNSDCTFHMCLRAIKRQQFSKPKRKGWQIWPPPQAAKDPAMPLLRHACTNSQTRSNGHRRVIHLNGIQLGRSDYSSTWTKSAPRMQTPTRTSDAIWWMLIKFVGAMDNNRHQQRKILDPNPDFHRIEATKFPEIPRKLAIDIFINNANRN